VKAQVSDLGLRFSVDASPASSTGIPAVNSLTSVFAAIDPVDVYRLTER